MKMYSGVIACDWPHIKLIWAIIGTILTYESNSIKLLGIIIDNNQLKFDYHISFCGLMQIQSCLLFLRSRINFSSKKNVNKSFL